MNDLTPPPEAGEATPERTKQKLRVWLRILRASRLVEAELREKLRASHGSTLPRFDVLAALDRHAEGLRMSELSAELKVSNGNVTGIVERLVGEGLAERASVAGDRRAMRVRLTEAGRARFADMAAAHAGWIDAILADFTEAELETLIALLARIGRERPA